MLILAFDTATDIATSALVDGGEVLGERVSLPRTVLADTYELLEFNSIIKSFPTVDQAVQKGFGKALAPAGKAVAASAAVADSGDSGTRWEPTAAGQPGNGGKKPWTLGRLLMPWKWF